MCMRAPVAIRYARASTHVICVPTSTCIERVRWWLSERVRSECKTSNAPPLGAPEAVASGPIPDPYRVSGLKTRGRYRGPVSPVSTSPELTGGSASAGRSSGGATPALARRRRCWRQRPSWGLKTLSKPAGRRFGGGAGEEPEIAELTTQPEIQQAPNPTSGLHALLPRRSV